MSRASPAPGTFKVKPSKAGGFVLSGVRADGSRHRVKVGSLTEGHTLGQTMFAGIPHAAPRPAGVVTSPQPRPEVDEFGLPAAYTLPQVSAETVKEGAPPPAPPAPPPAALVTTRRSNANTLSELLGITAAGGVAYLSNQFLEARYETVPKPSKKHLSDLAEEIKLGIQQTFGDREVGHWTMAILLTLGIPISMWIQASGRKKPKENGSPNLQAVP
jgi:hypothetical protein